MSTRSTRQAKTPFGAGLLKGLGVTLKHLLKPAATQQYPHERPTLAPRTRGVIGLMDENCTVCMLCARECPDWCIYIDSHKETVPPAKEGGRARTRNVLDRFAIDFALCMYCGICIEVCPFDALWWSPEFEYAEYSMDGLLHEMDRLREWADTVPPPPPLDEGAESPPEVTAAIEKKEAELDAAEAAERQAELEQTQAKDAPKDAGGEQPAAAPKEVEIDMASIEIDQAVYDELIAEGKSERMARSKAKAAAVRAAKAKAKELQAADDSAPAGDTTPPKELTLADVEVDIREVEPDPEVMQQLLDDGKSERMARSKAKAAAVKKLKQAKLDEMIAAQQAEAPAADTSAEPEAEPEPEPTLADVEVDIREVEPDPEVMQQLLDDGKSERIARSKAKAAAVKKLKQAKLDELLAARDGEGSS